MCTNLSAHRIRIPVTTPFAKRNDRVQGGLSDLRYPTLTQSDTMNLPRGNFAMVSRLNGGGFGRERISMKSLYLATIAVLVGASAHAQEPASGGPGSPKTELKTNREKASYCIGLNIGRDLKQQGLDLAIAKLAAGIVDGIRGNKPQLTDQEIRSVMEEFGKEHSEKRVAEFKAAAEKNIKEGEAFLAENKKKPGVITTKSGLQYKILKEGKGEKPAKTDVVTTHYVGTLLDGSEFDSSVKRGEPASFPLTGVIAGWTEALQLMPVGSKWRLFVPASLAYGAEGREPVIGPNSTLVFEVELLKIGEPEETAPPEQAPEQ